ncbi:hypothetical protein BpHYR1_017543, partial [Brachionus plicatilis]
ILFECGRDLSRFRYFIFFIGTKLDSTQLRQKIRTLELKLFKNINLQKDAISQAVKAQINRNDTDRLICFTLSIISYFELLIKKLNILAANFANETECLVKTEFDELNDLNTDEVTILDETSGQAALTKEVADDYNYDLESIKILKEEIEHLDVNLGRYNVRNESDDFLKRINQFDEEKQDMASGEQIQHNKPTKDLTTSDSKFKKIFHTNKRLCIFVISSIICLFIIGVVCGIIFGLKR